MPTLPGATGSSGSLLRESVLYTRMLGAAGVAADDGSTLGAEVAIGVVGILRRCKLAVELRRLVSVGERQRVRQQYDALGHQGFFPADGTHAFARLGLQIDSFDFDL